MKKLDKKKYEAKIKQLVKCFLDNHEWSYTKDVLGEGIMSRGCVHCNKKQFIYKGDWYDKT